MDPPDRRRSTGVLLLAWLLGALLPANTAAGDNQKVPVTDPGVTSPSTGEETQRPRIEAGWVDRVFGKEQRPEVCHYDATRVMGLQTEPFSVRMVTVPETLDRELYVAVVPPYGDKALIESVALRWSATIADSAGGDTAEMMILQVSRADPSSALKAVYSRQDRRGVVFKQFESWKNPVREVFHSWREGEGDGDRLLSWPPGRVLLEEQLLVLVRCLEFDPGRRYLLRVADGQLTDRTGLPEFQNTEIVCARPEKPITVPAGEFPPDRVREFQLVRADGLSAVYRVAEDAPNRLLEWETNDGRSLRLNRALDNGTPRATDYPPPTPDSGLR